jgi:hypothetical protein
MTLLAAGGVRGLLGSVAWVACCSLALVQQAARPHQARAMHGWHVGGLSAAVNGIIKATIKASSIAGGFYAAAHSC